MLSAKFLYSLAQFAEAAGEGEGARKIRSMATEWANSPEWEGDAPEGKNNEGDEVATIHNSSTHRYHFSSTITSRGHGPQSRDSL